MTGITARIAIDIKRAVIVADLVLGSNYLQRVKP